MNYIKAIFRCISAQVKWLRRGAVYSTPQVVQERLSKCLPCDFNVKDRCSLCKCPIIDKTLLDTEYCPISKW